MSFFQRIDEHADLMTRMAETLGVGLDEAVTDGRLSENCLSGAYLRCIGCREAEACSGFLAENAEGAEAAPDYCRNASLFEALTR